MTPPSSQATSSPGTRRDFPARFVAYAVTLLVVAAFLFLGGLDSALRPDGPVHTDLAGHIVALRAAGERLASGAGMRGWSDQWFAGYPGYYFYFPLPALLTLAVALLTPLEIAAKLVAVCAPLLILAGVTRLARSLGLGRTHVALAQIATLLFAVDASHAIYGGNILSSVLGEYAYAISLGFGLLFLSYVADHARGAGRALLPMSLLLAATALSHAIPTLGVVFVAALWLIRSPDRRTVVLSWLLAFGLTAFWSLPFVVRSPYMGHSQWVHGVQAAEIFPPALLLLLPWTLWGLVALRKHAGALLPFAALCLFGLAAYLVPHGLFGPGRGLPLWYLGFLQLTALGLGTLVLHARAGGRPLARVLPLAGVVALAGAIVVQSPLVRGRSAELLSASAPDRRAYDALVATLAALPPGQVHWEIRQRGSDQALGQIIPLTRIPDLVPGMRTTEGLFIEATHTALLYAYLRDDLSWEPLAGNPVRVSSYPVKRNRDAHADLLSQLGVNYLVTFTDSAHAFGARYPERITPLSAGDGWRLWRVAARPRVEVIGSPLHRVPRSEWKRAVGAWLHADALADRWTIIGEGPGVPTAERSAAGGVERVQFAGNRIRFRTGAVGVPHLIRASYFPSWRAHGATGPYLVAPGYMVVVPQQSDVELRFAATTVDRMGAVWSVLSVLIAGGIAVRGRRHVAPAPRG